MKLKLFIMATLVTATLMGANFLEQAEKVPVVSACKKHCPEAKTNAEAHECAERKGKIRKSFRKTNCWDVNEKYEDLMAKAKEGASKN